MNYKCHFFENSQKELIMGRRGKKWKRIKYLLIENGNETLKIELDIEEKINSPSDLIKIKPLLDDQKDKETYNLKSAQQKKD